MNGANSKNSHPLVSYFITYFPYALTFVFALILRFGYLGQQSLWIDEAFVAWFTDKPWLDVFYSLHLDGGNLPAHFVFVKILTRILGYSEFNLRLFSAIVSTLGVVLAVILGWMVGGKAGAWGAGWFWSFSPMGIWYARDAKPYALSSVLGLALLITYLVLIRGRSTVFRIIAFIVLVVGYLSHYYFFLVAMALIMIAIAEMRHKPLFFRNWFGLSMAAFLPLAVWLYWYLSQAEPHLGIGWIQQPVWRDISQTIWNLMSGYGGNYSLQSTLFGAITLVFCVFGLVSGPHSRLSRQVLVFGLIAVVGGVWIVSQKRPIYMDRYFIVLLPFITLLVGIGAGRLWELLVERIKQPLLSWITIIGLIILWVVGLWAGIQVFSRINYTREDWRGLVDYLNIQRENQPPALWFSDAEGIIPFRFYDQSEIQIITSEAPPECKSPCWWVLRQPYTATHAFAQGVTLENRPWLPVLPEGCQIENRWTSPSGIGLWQVLCSD